MFAIGGAIKINISVHKNSYKQFAYVQPYYIVIEEPSALRVHRPVKTQLVRLSFLGKKLLFV